MGCNSVKMQIRKSGICISYEPNGLPSTKKKRGRETGWIQAAPESTMVTETYGFASLQIPLRRFARELSAPGSKVFPVSGSAARSISYPIIYV